MSNWPYKRINSSSCGFSYSLTATIPVSAALLQPLLLLLNDILLSKSLLISPLLLLLSLTAPECSSLLLYLQHSCFTCSLLLQFILLLLGKGPGLRWRLSFEIKRLLLTKHMLSAQQKPYKLHAIARKRDLQKYPNSRSYCFHSQLHIILK